MASVPLRRIFRLFRIVRAARLMRAFGLKHMINEVVNDRVGSALYITVFAVIVLAEIAAILILKAEAPNPAANITSAGDAVWLVFVTITAVGYGDYYPTTEWGRIIGVFVIFCGIALLDEQEKADAVLRVKIGEIEVLLWRHLDGRAHWLRHG